MKINKIAILFVLLFFFSQIVIGQDLYQNLALSTVSWHKLPSQKYSGKAYDANKDGILVFTKIPDFVLQDGTRATQPVSSSFFVKNHSSKPTNHNIGDSLTDVDFYVAEKTTEELSEAAKLVEQTPMTPQWYKLKPQQYPKNICDDPRKSVVLVYSDFENFVLADGQNMASPVSSTLIADGIKKYVFCLVYPDPDLKNVQNLNNSDSLTYVTAFVVSKGGTRLTEILNLVEPQEKVQQEAAKTYTAKEISNKNKEEENTTQINSSQVNYENSASDEYKVQIIALKNHALNEKDIQQIFKLPYTVKIEKYEDFNRFVIGSYKTLEEAHKAQKEIREIYKIKDAFVALYQNKIRIATFYIDKY